MSTRKRFSDPKVSVVIPTYNRATELQRCLVSLTRQTFPEFEVLVCDDGSTDETKSVVESFSRDLDITCDPGAHWGGPARGRNRGIALARAPYIAFLDSDDWWKSEKLADAVECLETGADLAYHHLLHVAGDWPRFFWRQEKARRLTPPVFEDLLLNGNTISNSSVVVRKSVLLKIGGFSEERALIAFEDFDAWLRIARVSDKFRLIPRALGYYWVGGGNLSNPGRTIMCLDAMERRYSEDFEKLGDAHRPWWLFYSRGRALYREGRCLEAQSDLARVRWEDAPGLIWLKARFTELLIRMRRR